MRTLAVVLIILGCLGLLWGGINFTRSEKVVDLGPIEVRKDTKSNIPIPPILGLVGVAAGLVLLTRSR